MSQKIGILALQGGFDLHAAKIGEFGAIPILVKRPEQLAGLSGLILPGGESSVLLHLADEQFRSAIKARVIDGLPLLATCAGLIFIAEHVENPNQASLGLMPIDVIRNAYGRQIDSTIARELCWEDSSAMKGAAPLDEAVFIRAPKISRVGSGVDTLLRWRGDPVLVQYKNILGATFHPELALCAKAVYSIVFPQIAR